MVTEVINNLEDTFGEMMVIRGRKYTFFGIDIEFKDDSEFELSMSKDLTKYISAFGETFNGGAKTSARSTPFEIDNESKQ